MADPPKIIVDEDWKSRVQKEREIAASPEGASAPQQPPQPQQQPPPGSPPPMPQADLPALIEFLATHAMVELGFMAAPGEQPRVQLPVAKYFIDLLAMLQEKTQGNRTDEESQLLEGLLHQLRMGFIAVQRGGQ